MDQGLYDRTLIMLRQRGLAPSTVAAYARAASQLQRYCRKPLENVTEEDVRGYFTHVRDCMGWQPSTLCIAYSGLRLFFRHVLGRDWELFREMRFPHRSRLPVVLDPGEVRQLLAHMPRPRYRSFFGLVYGCGLRKSEAIHLKVADIDGKRGGVHVRDAKGGKDRWVPLPPSVLEMLREHWKTHRNPVWLFPAPGRAAGCAYRPISETAVQDAVRVAARRAGLRKRVTTHTLRHSYATHLIEAGVPICQVQEHLGHSSLKTTTVYLHVTTSGREETCVRLEQLMRGVLV